MQAAILTTCPAARGRGRPSPGALITDPDFIIADEPISSLDVSIQSQIIHLLKRLCDERHLTMLLIAHDRPMVEHVSDRVITMTTL